MMNSPFVIQARNSIEQRLRPRRQRNRHLLVQILLERNFEAHPRADHTLARIHDLCAQELAARIRIAMDELKKSCMDVRQKTVDTLQQELKFEIEAYLSEELSSLADDERLAAMMLEHQPAFALNQRQ